MFANSLIRFSVAALVLSALPALAQSMPGMPGMEGHHHDDGAIPAQKLGHVDFPVSCAAASQAPFELGIAMLHSFEYVDAERQFREIVKSDPTCAMAHWGVAMTQFQELWDRPSAARMKTGEDEMEAARQLAGNPPRITLRELMYINALGDFYALAPKDYQAAADAYAASMKELHEKNPDDIEGAAFYALSLLASVAPGDTSLTKERASLAVLEPLFEKHPQHPGLAHYIIHTCDTPALAQDGLAAARVYAKLAPSSPHALHMPGHIFARLGMWQEDIDSNVASVAASKQDEATGQPGAAHQMHADEFLVYAYLQVGEDAKAQALTAEMPSVAARMAAMPGMDDMKDAGPYFVSELNVITPMELREWPVLAALKPASGVPAWQLFYTYWGQGIGAGRLHNAKDAATALAQFDVALEELKKTPFASMEDSLKIKRNELAAWQAFAEDRRDAAITAMRAAADQQDKLGQGEVDIPAREMLGDLLMALHRPQEALAEYKVALRLSPNRLNGLLSAGAAAEAASEPQMAATYYAAAAHNTHGAADSKRPALLHAVSFVQRHHEINGTKAE